MTTVDDHPSPSDDELVRLGVRLRADADARAADLDGLGSRIRADRQRTRIALVAACAALVLVLVLALGTRLGGTDDSLSVAGVDGGEPGTSAFDTVAGSVPSWTVNPSIPVDAGIDQVWAIEITYDPAVWDFHRFTQVPGLSGLDAMSAEAWPIGMASYHDEPIVQVYWAGDRGREAAESAEASLEGQPGILSVEVGLATPTSRTPGTGAVVPSVPLAPTTLASIERRELPDPRPTQAEILADGTVTDDEYELAFWTWVECAEAAGVTVDVRGRGDDGRIQYSVSAGVPAADSCYQSHFVQVDMTWQLALDRSSGPPTT